MPKPNFFTKRAILIEFATATIVLFLLLYVMVPRYLYQQSERYAIELIEEYGGTVHYVGNDHVVEINLAYTMNKNQRVPLHNSSDNIMYVLPRFKHLKELSIHGSQASDHAMSFVGQLQSLETLNMRESIVSDAGIQKLKNIKNLKSINCDKSNLTDEALKTLAQLPTLTSLSVQHNKISGTVLLSH